MAGGLATDPYAPTAPYYDVMASSMWSGLGSTLAALLTHVGPKAGPVIDIGAGTGLSTVVIAESLPESEVWAVEPSASMRAMLLGHLAWRPDVRDRVTVLAGDALSFDWPAEAAAVVACNMIGHLDREERAVLWERLATRMAAGGFAVIGLQPPSRPERLPRIEMTAVEIGRHRYVGFAEAEPTGPRSMRWTMTYQKTAGADVLDEAVNTFDWWTVDLDDVRDEVAGISLVAEPRDDGLVMISRG